MIQSSHPPIPSRAAQVSDVTGGGNTLDELSHFQRVLSTLT